SGALYDLSVAGAGGFDSESAAAGTDRHDVAEFSVHPDRRFAVEHFGDAGAGRGGDGHTVRMESPGAADHPASAFQYFEPDHGDHERAFHLSPAADPAGERQNSGAARAVGLLLFPDEYGAGGERDVAGGNAAIRAHLAAVLFLVVSVLPDRRGYRRIVQHVEPLCGLEDGAADSADHVPDLSALPAVRRAASRGACAEYL